MTASLTPAKDTFRVGDTLIIESTFFDQVYEKKTGQTFLLENWNLYPRTVLFDLNAVPVTDNALKDFDVIVEEKYDYDMFHHTTSDRIILIGEYNNINGLYTLELALITKKPGFFMLNQYSSLYPQGSEQDFPGKCGGESEAYFLLNEGKDNNVAFLEEIEDDDFYRLMMDDLQLRFYDSGGYCFYVTE